MKLSFMIKILYIIFLSLIITNCSFKKVVKHHGVPFLEKKQASLIVNKSNKNDIKKILGNPSTTSKFDNDTWIYIERKQTQSELKNLGRMKIFKNDVLVLEIDNYGILKKKDFYNKDDLEKIKIVDTTTKSGFRKNTFIYDFMSSMRQKINDPLGQRAKKRKEISQR
jgi:outer membrane protein assembly factor BamE (lipoprotein component of BamABCDE complex)